MTTVRWQPTFAGLPNMSAWVTLAVGKVGGKGQCCGTEK